MGDEHWAAGVREYRAEARIDRCCQVAQVNHSDGKSQTIIITVNSGASSTTPWKCSVNLEVHPHGDGK